MLVSYNKSMQAVDSIGFDGKYVFNAIPIKPQGGDLLSLSCKCLYNYTTVSIKVKIMIQMHMLYTLDRRVGQKPSRPGSTTSTRSLNATGTSSLRKCKAFHLQQPQVAEKGSSFGMSGDWKIHQAQFKG